jgi:hypothetical protein
MTRKGVGKADLNPASCHRESIQTKIMNTRIRSTILTTVLLTALALSIMVVASAFGQTNLLPGLPGQPSIPAPASALLKQLQPVQFLLVPATTVLITVFRRFIPKIPSQAWPFVAPFIGATLDYAAGKAGLWTGNAAVGAMLGGLGTWFHQLDKQTLGLTDKIAGVAPKPTTPVATQSTTASTSTKVG